MCPLAPGPSVLDVGHPDIGHHFRASLADYQPAAVAQRLAARLPAECPSATTADGPRTPAARRRLRRKLLHRAASTAKQQQQQQQQQQDATSPPVVMTYAGAAHAWPDGIVYRYPQPTAAIVGRMAAAIASLPRLYVQVLHLMNVMNLPPPFDLDSSPVCLDPALAPTGFPPVYEDVLEAARVGVAKRQRGLDSDESELESDEEDTPHARPIAPAARPSTRLAQPKRKTTVSGPASTPAPAAVAADASSTPVPVPHDEPLASKAAASPRASTPPRQARPPNPPQAQGPTLTPTAPAKPLAGSNPASAAGSDMPKAPAEGSEAAPLVASSPAVPRAAPIATAPASAVQSAIEAITTREELLAMKLPVEQLTRDYPRIFGRSAPPGAAGEAAAPATSRLFLKNLHRSVNETLLSHLIDISLSGLPSASDRRYSLRVLEKRMRGQAFANFECELAAQHVRHDLYGLALGDKPLCVDFGK
ncbi:hypothetical protein H696_04872 [Fonticula alba]|uniref:RRM domain-containing protein n=1 Tax=Fonticula alba TaxID=691883 RepID=A0A058Z3U3_FONAL|nr:hypothetical protein H696_04872 [Fonticula alba]KCV68578.1 hypothetical protein H696_04872 [Fonticula alba]|eukprot:XP_009497010.1 hypothetical protein H696_04872 [Fonticula alba]